MKRYGVLSALAVLAFVALPGRAVAADGPTSGAISLSPDWLSFPAAAFAQSQLSQADWQRQYDSAKARRSSGLKKVIIGLVMEGGGVAMVMAGATTCAASSFDDDCSGSGAVAGIGALTAVAGAVPFWWGVIQWVGANGDVRSLEATQPRTPSTQLVPLSDHQAIQFSAGLRPTVGYRLNW